MRLEKKILSNNTKFMQKQYQKMGIEIDNEAFFFDNHNKVVQFDFFVSQGFVSE